MAAKFLVIEGIDQSGKDTQTRLLVRGLRWEGYRVETLSYPVYTSFSGREIREFLAGKRSYPFQAVHMLYSVNRWETLYQLKRLLETTDYIIADRYTPSNLAYGTARGLDWEWLRCLDKGLPEPDKVVVIDTSVEASFHRKTEDRDLHERDKSFLEKVRRSYLQLGRRLGWTVVNGDRQPNMVYNDLLQLVVKNRQSRKTSSNRLGRVSSAK